MQTASEPPVLLYDGACGFCSATVRFVLRRDRSGTLRFASLQSAYASAVLREHSELKDVDSVVWFEPAKGLVLVRSSAALRIARYLGGPWSLALAFWIVPVPIRDYVYRLIARHRHRLLAASEQCLVPPLDARHRFLDAG